MQKAGFSCPKVISVSLTTFTKSASNPSTLLTKLEGQGLQVADRSTALNYLQYVGGYRLKGYWHHLIDKATNQFPQGYNFTDIANRCEFDRELRAATIEAIDRLEVAIRSSIANYLSQKHGPHWFLKPSAFKPTKAWGLGQLLQKIESEVGRGKNNFVKHYFSKHDDPYLPPSWSISECVSFGLWSRTYEILRDTNDKKAIAMKFNIDQPNVFASWIHAITVLRNVVAHHGQLLGNTQNVSPCEYKRLGIIFKDNKQFFALATVIQYMLTQTSLPNRWKADLKAIFDKYPTVNILEVGFPQKWESQPGW